MTGRSRAEAHRRIGGSFGPWRIALGVLLALDGVVLAAITAVNHAGAERWWFGALNLYLPQALWAVPALLLLAVAPLAGWRWAALPALYLVWVLGPIMGFRWSARTVPEPGAGPVLRILTCNAKFGLRDSGELIRDIVRYRPEVVLLQDADGLTQSPVGDFFRPWHVRYFGQFVIASRLPLSGVEVHEVALPGGGFAFLRGRVTLGGTAITVFNVHFQSPRESLNAFREDRDGNWSLPDAIRELERNAAFRLQQSQVLANLVAAEPGPVILAGDLNSPEPSRVCATLKRAGLQDAFSEGGRGYGYTYGQFLLQHRIPWLHLSWMRLDHIMVGPRLRVWRCWVGTGKASDHRPVVADLILK